MVDRSGYSTNRKEKLNPMQTQNFSNHVKKHPLFHHFIIPVSLALVIASAVNLWMSFGLVAILLFVISILLHLVAFIARDYAKKNQDRIIRSEMRLRYFLLTGESFAEKESQLSFGQLAALRFATDEELIPLLKAKTTYTLSPKEIKERIREWNPDHMRV